MQDAWRAYLELALGLTEAPRKKAQSATRRLVGSSGATAAQLQALAEELVSTGLANREALTKIVRFEVDRALGAVGLATADEVAELTRRVQELERELRAARAEHDGNQPTSSESVAGPATAAPVGVETIDAAAGAPTRAVAKKTTSTKAVAKKAVADVAVAKKAVAKKAVAKKAVTTKPAPTVTRTPSTSASRRAGEAGSADGAKLVEARKLPTPAARKAAARRQPPPEDGAR